MKLLKSRKGFTLVELCIVLAVSAIVATMIITTIVFITGQNNKIQNEASFISDVTDIQKKVNGWLKKYDNAGYIITDIDSQTKFEARKSNDDVSTISFSGNKILIVENGETTLSNEYKNVSEVNFQIRGNDDERVAQIRVRAIKGKGTEDQTLLFPLFSNKTRERSVTGKNG